MRVLVIGNGGREHALCWLIRERAPRTDLYCAPGSPGTEECGESVAIDVSDIDALAGFAAERGIDLTVVGPELPLSLGVVDAFRQRGLRIFGPSRAAARLESSKVFAKEFMHRHGVPTSDFIVADALVSRVHCRLTASAQQLVIEDLQSTNGTYVNGVRLKLSTLEDGDRVRLGQVEFNVVREDAPTRRAASARSSRSARRRLGV